MGKSLYRSYRSKSFDEIIGQDHITTTLKNALKNNAVSHAYLLSGPRGVGKTSVARILAYAVNDQDYDLEKTNLDIIEIDAASNRRIDEIREIRERVNIAPSVGKYKVYIIDEVHMLTREAFNALLKTLEEPPDHAIFILATTESHKVPDTIISRCIQLNFKPIEPAIISDHLKMIAKSENIKLSDAAADLLASHSKGSFRDAISLLEQVKFSSNEIEPEHVTQMLGLATEETLNAVLTAIDAKSTGELAASLLDAYSNGTDVASLTAQLQDKFREILVSGEPSSLSSEELLRLQKELLNVPGSPKPRLQLELTLMEYSMPASEIIHPKTQPQSPASHGTPVSKKKPLSTPKTETSAIEIKPPAATKRIDTKLPTNPVKTNELWDKFLEELKKTNNTLYGIARMAEVCHENETLHLKFKFAFHRKRVDEPKNKSLFSELLAKINGSPVELVTSLAENTKTTDLEADDTLQNVSNIFGAHEVIES